MAKPLPTISLAKREAKEGSREWLDQVTHEHSKTSPQQLERRRLRLSSLATIVDRCIRNVQIQKKVLASSTRKMRDAALAEREVAKKSIVKENITAFDAETDRMLSEIDAAFQNQIINFEVTIAQLTGQLASIEGNCLIVDCLSVRHDVKPKGKKLKWGKTRWSVATFISEMGLHMFETNVMVKEIFKKILDADAADALERVEKVVAEDVEDDVDDEDIVTEDDEEDVKKEVEKKGEGDE